MKALPLLISLSLSVSTFAAERTIRISQTGGCSSTVERNTLAIFSQKFKLKSCAKENAVEQLYYDCETRKAGQLIDHASPRGNECISEIVWGGRFVRCTAQVTGECQVSR